MTADFSALLLAIFLALGMAYMAASFVTFIVQERVSKVRHRKFIWINQFNNLLKVSSTREKFEKTAFN